MSILIKGMDIPIMKDNTGMRMEICKIGGKIEIGIKDGLPLSSEQWHYYPIAEVPESHGRLIDADACISEIIHHLGIASEEYLLSSEKAVVDVIKDASTVIEAEGQDYDERRDR